MQYILVLLDMTETRNHISKRFCTVEKVIIHILSYMISKLVENVFQFYRF